MDEEPMNAMKRKTKGGRKYSPTHVVDDGDSAASTHAKYEKEDPILNGSDGSAQRQITQNWSEHGGPLYFS